MKLFIDIVMKRIYLFNIVAWNYRKKIGFPVCKKENFVGLQAHRKGGKSARASPTPHHTLNEERSARFTAQHLSALFVPVRIPGPRSGTRPRTGVYDQMEQLFTDRKFHFCYHRNFRVFFVNGKRPWMTISLHYNRLSFVNISLNK